MASMGEQQTTGWIVVGVDGSEHSRRALEWALGEAKLRQAGCVLVHAWNYGLVGASPWPGEAAQTLGDAAQLLLDNNVAFARSFGVPLDARLECGSASQALVDASRDALMLVVGNRGHGGFTGALLGSVSTACVHHACCPVVVIPPAARAAGGRVQVAS
jgi:nucleotide-binding universal stress UspA family protein